MKFVTERENLLAPLQMVSGVVERKHQQPIMSHVLLQIKTHQLTVVGSDCEVELQGRTTLSEPAVAGDITVPARKLIDIVRALPEETMVELSFEDNQCLIKAGSRRRYKLATLPADEFPAIEQNEQEAQFSLSPNDLYQLLDATAFSMANQDVRYYLNGLLMGVEDGKLTTVATDGHRLALSRAQNTPLPTDEAQIILPRKGVVELLRLIDPHGEEAVEVSLSPNHIKVHSAQFSFISKLIEGRYPDYHTVIPQSGDIQVHVDCAELKSALSRVSILTNDKFKGVRLGFSKDGLQVSTQNPEQEQAEETLDIEYDGEPLEMGFNVSYLIDVLNNIASPHATLSFSDASSSVLIRAKEDDQSLYVVMPLRI